MLRIHGLAGALISSQMLAVGRTAAAAAAAAAGHRFGTVVIAGGVRRDATQPSQAKASASASRISL